MLHQGPNIKLAEQIADHFDPIIRMRGRDYFKQGAVELVSLEGANAEFTVSGAQPYTVHLSHCDEPDQLDFECSCPFFRDGSNCKHIWGSILFLDAHRGRELSAEIEVAPTEAEPVVNSKQVDWRDKMESAKLRVAQERRARQFGKTGAPAKKTAQKIGTYAIDLSQSVKDGRIFLEIYAQERLAKGGLGALRPADLVHDKIEFYEDAQERDFLWDLLGRTQVPIGYHNAIAQRVNSLYLSSGHADGILRKISDARKLFWIKPTKNRYYGAFDKPAIIPYDYHSEAWNFFLKLERKENAYELSGYLKTHTDEVRSVSQVVDNLNNFVFFEDFCARSDLYTHQVWYELIKARPLVIEEADLDAFMQQFLVSDGAKVPLSLPAEIELTETTLLAPRPRISFTIDKNSGHFHARLSFMYGDSEAAIDTGAAIYNFANKTKINRDLAFEAEQYLQFLKLEPSISDDPTVQGYFTERNFVHVAEKCMGFGWEVLARGQSLKLGGSFEMRSKSETDWFDLQVDFKFENQTIGLPQLLYALKSGQRTIKLGDGSTGLLPEEWLSRFAPLLGIGKQIEGGLRLSKVQALFYSATLTENDKFTGDKKFSSLKKILRDLTLLEPIEPDQRFKGILRDYQKEGLSWLRVISDHQIGGILADDMGLGKTIQILSLLCQPKKHTKPTLILAPKSLIFNWENEAKKFTPDLKVFAYTGANRRLQKENLLKADLILTTYHTMRNDIDVFKTIDFDFLILDEAHQIKNSQSQANQAARLLRADKKIALTGTPIENSLMDLFSILGVVTPGLVSEAQAQRWVKENEPAKIQLLGRALGPFLLRRTKDQVLKDLPEKSEQVLYCELSDIERKKYDDLKNYYWGQLSGKIQDVGLGKAKIQVLEALLRLRQASCHLGLLDDSKRQMASSKFEMVLEQIDVLIQDGHKALVFSQFTSLLDLFSEELKKKKIKFQYLDGQTRDRAERVQSFQEDSDIPVFLLSLKAGGVGLNLTAADFVFILDPWWNPAAESQAIDRTHRIGQTKKVLAYKVIAKNTIEEKILQLQEKKKMLARAVISNDASLLKGLQMEDLKELFT